MLIVDSQVHIWKDAKLGAHHRQIPTYSKDELLKEMDTAGVDAIFSRGGVRAPAPEVKAAE